MTRPLELGNKEDPILNQFRLILGKTQTQTTHGQTIHRRTIHGRLQTRVLTLNMPLQTTLHQMMCQTVAAMVAVVEALPTTTTATATSCLHPQ